MKRVFILHADGRVTYTDSKKNPSYDVLSKAVGGMIETVPYFTKLSVGGKTYTRGTAYCNEEGHVLGLPLNHVASSAWMRSCPNGDPNRMVLAGDVIYYASIPA